MVDMKLILMYFINLRLPFRGFSISEIVKNSILYDIIDEWNELNKKLINSNERPTLTTY